jgi:HK97 family phage major capsid protein
MAVTLSESAKLSLDMLRRGVVETIIEASPILQYLPFIQVNGNSYKWNQETALGGASFYAVNGVWTEATATFTQQTANLSILGGDADVDNFIARTRDNVNDQRAVQTALKAKSVARAFETTFMVGDATVDTNSFNGLRNQVATAQKLNTSGNGAALSLDLMDQLVDLIKPGKPDLILMSKRSRRRLKALLVANTHYVESGTNQFGRQVMTYDGIPVEVSDFQPDDETQNAGSALSSVWAIQFGEEGVFGIQNGDGPETVDIGQLESKDGSRVRIRWYVAAGVARNTALAVIKGVNAS